LIEKIESLRREVDEVRERLVGVKEVMFEDRKVEW
jgi:hypothetical protein